MGLDIRYYSNIKELESEIDEDDYDEEVIRVYENDGFDYQLGSLKKNALYIPTDNTETGSFRAGSYGGYNQWRNMLAMMAGYESDESVWNDFDSQLRYIKIKNIEGENIQMKPFYELIYFSDCEGVIGPNISKKLHQDFVDFHKKIKGQDRMFIEKYKEWETAFKVASNNGLVKFS